MANFDYINLLPRHVAVNYLKLKSDTSKVNFYFYCLFHFLLAILLSLFSYLQLHLPYLVIVAYTFVIVIINCSLEKHC